MSDADEPIENTKILPVVEERLEVGRRRIETGAVRVRKLVHEDQVELDGCRVTESVETQRVPVGRVIERPLEVRQEGDTTIVPVMEERVVMHKELVLVEEVRITRRRQVQRAQETATVRRESVVVERLDPATQEWRVIAVPQSGDAAADPDKTDATDRA